MAILFIFKWILYRRMATREQMRSCGRLYRWERRAEGGCSDMTDAPPPVVNLATSMQCSERQRQFYALKPFDSSYSAQRYESHLVAQRYRSPIMATIDASTSMPADGVIRGDLFGSTPPPRESTAVPGTPDIMDIMADLRAEFEAK